MVTRNVGGSYNLVAEAFAGRGRVKVWKWGVKRRAPPFLTVGPVGSGDVEPSP